MKRFLALILALAMLFSLAACSGGGDDPTGESATETKNMKIRLATTTSVNDSGLLDYLLPYFEAKTGYTVEVASAGTGKAIEFAKSGDADLLLVHSKAQEEAFIEEGYSSTERLSFMYNYFVIVGPTDDPANIKDLTSAADCFKAIAEAGAAFASRGDNSGTHNKETSIWKAAGITPDTEDWYASLDKGMDATLTTANEMKAYALTDKATFLANQANYPNLTLLKAEAEDMKNTYSLLGVKADAKAFEGKSVTINTEGANALIDWMRSEEAAKLIAEYGMDKYGESLFFVIQ